MQGLPQLLLLLQLSEDFAPDALQALHLALALIHLALQGLHAEGQLGTEEEEVKQFIKRQENKKNNIMSTPKACLKHFFLIKKLIFESCIAKLQAHISK